MVLPQNSGHTSMKGGKRRVRLSNVIRLDHFVQQISLFSWYQIFRWGNASLSTTATTKAAMQHLNQQRVHACTQWQITWNRAATEHRICGGARDGGGGQMPLSPILSCPQLCVKSRKNGHFPVQGGQNQQLFEGLAPPEKCVLGGGGGGRGAGGGGGGGGQRYSVGGGGALSRAHHRVS